MASNSIMMTDKRCFYCGSEVALQRHHCLKGTDRRKLAEEDGLWIWICPYHHDFIHGKDGHAHDAALKRKAELAWLQHNKDKDELDWLARYGKHFI